MALYTGNSRGSLPRTTSPYRVHKPRPQAFSHCKPLSSNEIPRAYLHFTSFPVWPGILRQSRLVLAFCKSRNFINYALRSKGDKSETRKVFISNGDDALSRSFASGKRTAKSATRSRQHKK